jgi:hypothetical protein
LVLELLFNKTQGQSRLQTMEAFMQVELRCSSCSCHFVAPPETSAEEIIHRMTHEGPWYALGDGETFEDMIFSSLTRRGEIRCPDCGDAVSVSEESLSQLAMEMLAQW